MAVIATPPLTTVAAPTAVVGQAAVDLLLGPRAGLAGDGRQAREIKTELRVRGSTGPAPEAGRAVSGSGARRVAV
jgi:DNA-binding LacI/PurR family transcriptional regulator